MKHSYHDILTRIDEAPCWFDEHGVPRFEAFSPDMMSDAYTWEAVLFEIRCQCCGKPFRVAKGNRAGGVARSSLKAAIDGRTLHYGDPPSTGCCVAGETMNSVPVKVLELWRRSPLSGWERDSTRDGISIMPAWAMAKGESPDVDIVESD